MTVDPSLLIEGDFVLVRMALVDAVGWPAAAVLQRIYWRCERADDGEWGASHADIATEVRLPLRTVERATKELRDMGWLSSRRASAWDPTTVWAVPGIGGHVGGAVAVTVRSGLAVTPSSKKKEEVSGFDAFWEVYPRKIGKGAARKSYDKALTKASAQVIHFGAASYATYVEATPVEPSYIKHPSTWLNQECWDDVLPSKAKRGPKISAWR